MKHTTTKRNLSALFKPASKRDTATHAYIGNDGSLVVVFQRHTDLGSQYYVHVAIRAFEMSLRGTWRSTSLATEVTRIYVRDVGLLSVLCATGKPVSLEIWPDNGSTNTRERGLSVQTIEFHVHGLGKFSVNNLPGVMCSAFDLHNTGDTINAQSLREDRRTWRDYAILQFDDVEDTTLEHTTPIA